MTRARELAKLVNTNIFTVSGSNNVGLGSTGPTVKLDVGGIIKGDGSELTNVGMDTSYISGIAATFTGNVNVGGVLTYEDVTNIDSVGIITAQSGIRVLSGGLGMGGLIPASGNLVVNSSIRSQNNVSNISYIGFTQYTGDTTVGSMFSYMGGDGRNTGYLNFSTNDTERLRIDSTGNILAKTIDVRIGSDVGAIEYGTSANNSVRFYQNNTEYLRIDSGGAFGLSGSNYGTAGQVLSSNGSSAAPTWEDASGGGITTEAQVKTTGQTALLTLSSAVDHKVTCTGTVTIDVTGGTLEGESHTLRIVNNGTATVGFSTHFLFPSGSVPSLPTADGTISLISFTIHRAGSTGISTQLLSGSSVNYS